MAVLQSKGDLQVGQDFVGLSIIDSRFECRIEALTDLQGVAAIIPSISGRAWITETRQLLLDPSDPWPGGYRIADTWPG